VDTEDLMKKLKIQNDKHASTLSYIDDLKVLMEEYDDKLAA
jgi:hypothetical protein